MCVYVRNNHSSLALTMVNVQSFKWQTGYRTIVRCCRICSGSEARVKLHLSIYCIVSLTNHAEIRIRKIACDGKLHAHWYKIALLLAQVPTHIPWRESQPACYDSIRAVPKLTEDGFFRFRAWFHDVYENARIPNDIVPYAAQARERYPTPEGTQFDYYPLPGEEAYRPILRSRED
jgi:hypothetical protein